MRFHPDNSYSIIVLFLLIFVLTSCAYSCPPECLEENLGAVDWSGKNLSSKQFINSSARHANFANVNFSSSDLTGFDLVGANLTRINLTNATLIGANLESAHFSGAIFSGTDLRGANMASADLTGTVLNTSILRAINFSKTNMVNIDLSQSNLAGSDFSESKAAGANFNRTNLAGGIMDNMDLSGADLRYSDMRGSWINLASLVGANLQGADLSGVSMIASDLSGCNLAGASLVGANLLGANLRGADLRGADLRTALLKAEPGLLDKNKYPDGLIKNMSTAQWEKLAIGDTLLDGTKYDKYTKWPAAFNKPPGLIYASINESNNADVATNSINNLTTITGSQSVLFLAKSLAKGYMEKHPEYFFAFSSSNSSDGIQQVIHNGVDVGMSSRSLTNEETKFSKELELIPIAQDSIVVVVNQENSIEDLSGEQLRSIFSGEVTNWKDLGGPELKIELIIQDDSLIDVFRNSFMDNKEITLKNSVIVPSNAAVRSSVAKNKGAIGLLPTMYKDHSIKMLSINGVKSTSASIESGLYPLLRPFFLVVRKENNKQVQEWLNYIYSEDGRLLIKMEGLEPVPNGK